MPESRAGSTSGGSIIVNAASSGIVVALSGTEAFSSDRLDGEVSLDCAAGMRVGTAGPGLVSAGDVLIVAGADSVAAGPSLCDELGSGAVLSSESRLTSEVTQEGNVAPHALDSALGVTSRLQARRPPHVADPVFDGNLGHHLPLAEVMRSQNVRHNTWRNQWQLLHGSRRWRAQAAAHRLVAKQNAARTKAAHQYQQAGGSGARRRESAAITKWRELVKCGQW
jgi:hypothetical protein